MEIVYKEGCVERKQFNFNGESLDLPGCILYSRGGIVPHLTDENFKLIENIPHKFSSLSLSSIYEQPGCEVMREFGKSFHEFSSTQDTTWILNPLDSHVTKPDIYKYNEEKCISVWAPSGRRKINPEEYMKVVETFSFDAAVVPSDCIPSGLTTKRCRKSQERSIRFLDQCLKLKNEQKLKTLLFGVVQGGDCVQYREKCAKELALRDVDGYVIGGLDISKSPNWNTLLEVSLKALNKDKVKLMYGVLTPVEIVQAVQAGVDLFDSVIAFDVAQRGCALNFPFKKSHESITNDKISNNAKKAKTEDNDNQVNVTRDLSLYELDLTNRCHFDDTQPLFAGCKCYTCTNFVRAYLHHLLVTKEMLAQVLLMIHNLTHWFEFFEEIKRKKDEQKLEDLLLILTDYITDHI